MMEFGENDYKYILQEFSKTMIGARYTYSEIMAAERAPFKFQTIIDRLILPYADPDMMIGDHILHMDKADKNYRIYENLKIKIRCCVPDGDGYKTKDFRINEITGLEESVKDTLVVQEIAFSNLALMGFKL